MRSHANHAVHSDSSIEAIVTGRIADPEAVYYRNAKWLKELSELGTRDHRSLIGMLDMMASVGVNH